MPTPRSRFPRQLLSCTFPTALAHRAQHFSKRCTKCSAYQNVGLYKPSPMLLATRTVQEHRLVTRADVRITCPLPACLFAGGAGGEGERGLNSCSPPARARSPAPGASSARPPAAGCACPSAPPAPSGCALPPAAESRPFSALNLRKPAHW